MDIKINKKQYEIYRLILLQRRRKKKQAEEIFQPVGLCLVDDTVSGGQWAYVNEAGDVVDAPDFDRHPLFTGPQDEIIDGQYMVRFPAAWIQRRVNFAGPHVGKEVWFAHHGPRTGYELHNAFWWGGLPKSKIWLGKYQASLDDDARLSSVPGVLPAANITIGGFDTAACLRNEDCSIGGWVQQNFWMWSWLQYLTLLRYATMDIQAAVGQGRVDESSAALVDAPDVAQATVFGVVGAWGNVWQLARGAQFEYGEVWLWDKNQQLVSTGVIMSSLTDPWLFPTSFSTGEVLSHGFIASARRADSQGALCQDASFVLNTHPQRVLRCGGTYSSWGPRVGLWGFAGNTNEAHFFVDGGSRLAKVDVDIET